MPGWDIHTAHVERLLREHTAGDLGIWDTNCFLFGNFVPDIYVGYLVHPISKAIDYRITHLANPYHMPEPDYATFWQRFALPSANVTGRVSDIVLGAWAHLVADHIYNHHANVFISSHGIPFGDVTRIRKQNDFHTFGHTFDLHLVPVMTKKLVSQCAAFPQYEIAAADIGPAIEAATKIVEDTHTHHIYGTPNYDLLPLSFFNAVFDEVDDVIARGLLAYACQLK